MQILVGTVFKKALRACLKLSELKILVKTALLRKWFVYFSMGAILPLLITVFQILCLIQNDYYNVEIFLIRFAY